MIGSVAQWLGRQSLAGGLSLIYSWHVTTSRVRCPLWVYNFNQTNSAFHSSGVGKWVVLNVITWITGVETIKWQTTAVYGWLVVGQSVGAGLAYGL